MSNFLRQKKATDLSHILIVNMITGSNEFTLCRRLKNFRSLQEFKLGGEVEFSNACFVKPLDECGGKTIALAYYFK